MAFGMEASIAAAKARVEAQQNAQRRQQKSRSADDLVARVKQEGVYGGGIFSKKTGPVKSDEGIELQSLSKSN